MLALAVIEELTIGVKFRLVRTQADSSSHAQTSRKAVETEVSRTRKLVL